MKPHAKRLAALALSILMFATTLAGCLLEQNPTTSTRPSSSAPGTSSSGAPSSSSGTPSSSPSTPSSSSKPTSPIVPPTSSSGPTTPAVPSPSIGDLLITEVMASNSATAEDSFGDSADWIELHNTTDKAISLDGFYLSDSEGNPTKFALPDVSIAAHAYLVVFASDRDTITAENEIHTNFKISAGENVLLSYGQDLYSMLNAPADLPTDISYGFITNGEGYLNVYFATPTPGAENGGTYAEVLGQLQIPGSGLLINEFMMNNEGIFYDEDGDCPDWVELRNASDQAISLSGFGLSDSFDDPLKWVFPDITLQPGAYLLILLSGKSKDYTDQSIYLHADFKLGDTDDGLILSNEKGLLIDRIGTVQVPDNTSYGRDPGDTTLWKFFTRPTPGWENSANGFDELSSAQAALTQKVYINEVCAVSSNSVTGLDKEDWIELYNNTPNAINLEGWSLSKYISDLRFYTFPSVTIQPYSYLVISASGVASQNTKSLDVGFKVSHTGNTLYLVDADGLVTDAFSTGLQRSGVTSGRVVENNTLVRRFFTTATKGKANNGTGSSQAYAQPVVLQSSAGVLVADSHTVTMSTLQPGATIYYTTDGTAPTDASLVYTGPITLEKSASIRAIAYADGFLPSQIATQTFLITDGHKLNVVCLTCDPDDLFSDERGIWANGPGYTETFPHKGANFWKDWEREVFFEYYETDGTLGIAFAAGMKNHGQYSRAQTQKSVSINLKEAYGSGTSYYPFFGSDQITVFDNLLLRTGGQDWNYTNLIDAYCARVVNGQMDLDIMRDIPVALYVNGEYWGMYYVREKINESYLYNHHGIEEDNLDLIKGNSIVQAGSYTAHKALLNYIKNHDLSNQEYFDYVASQIDIEEWTNYWITESFFGNTDTGNIRFYCTKDGTGKWRWILFDMDWALYPSTYKWNMLAEFLATSGHGVGNAFSTVIARGLFQNADFRWYFAQKYAEYLHTVFAKERLTAILDEMVAQIDEEMVRQCDRWGVITYTKWKSNVNKLYDILEERWDLTIDDLKESCRLTDAQMAQLFPELYQ